MNNIELLGINPATLNRLHRAKASQYNKSEMLYRMLYCKACTVLENEIISVCAVLRTPCAVLERNLCRLYNMCSIHPLRFFFTVECYTFLFPKYLETKHVYIISVPSRKVHFTYTYEIQRLFLNVVPARILYTCI